MSAFHTQGDARGAGDVATIGVGMLGYAFMGKAHANAYRKLSYMTWPPPLMPDLVAIAGRNEEAVAEAARRYGFTGHVTDWHALLDDERIGLFDNSGPNNLHAEPTIAAAQAGKHVICEKPLGRDADESYETGSACRPPASSTCARSTTASSPPSACSVSSSRPARSGRSTTSAAPTCRVLGHHDGGGMCLPQGRRGVWVRSATSART